MVSVSHSSLVPEGSRGHLLNHSEINASAFWITLKYLIYTPLSYGDMAISLNKKCLKELSTTQGNLVEAMLGLKRCSRTSLHLQSVKTKLTAVSVVLTYLLRSCLYCHSTATDFYAHVLKSSFRSQKNTVVERCVSLFKPHRSYECGFF